MNSLSVPVKVCLSLAFTLFPGDQAGALLDFMACLTQSYPSDGILSKYFLSPFLATPQLLIKEANVTGR